MFESLSEKLERALQVVKGDHRISEIKIAETAKEIRRVLVDADVNYKIAKEFTDRVKERAIGERVHTSLNPRQVFIKIVKDQLTELMGGGAVEVSLEGKPAVILIAGLQGSGKTTFSGKLALHLKTKKHRKVLLVAGDVYRPAAIDQLKVLAEGIGVEVYTEEGNKNPVEIAQHAIAYAREHGLDTVIVDTAGRLAVDEEMMDEISRVHAAVHPSETLFVVDAMTGQDAVNTAKAFNDRLDFDGVVLTKLDGDTRGGAALSIKATVNKPIKFSSTGEKMDALEVFHPERLADRIMGMGDIVTLVEKVNAQYDEAKAKELERKFRKNQFGFDDFLAQIAQIKKMGNMKDLLGMLPGVGKALKNVDIPDDAFKHVEAIICSMTPQERRNPEIINGQRKVRIARGSGRTVDEVNRLMKQFEDMKKMMKMMQGGGGGAMARMMGGMGGRRPM
ncbi:MAG TPA: signal recognition particle protein [Bacteroidetes bacterium]|nr:signal recognition particle protein [Bacteroidota bacterium]